METTLHFGMKVRVKPLSEIHQFLHGAVGMIIPSPSEHTMRERKLLRFDKDIVHPYGGVMRSMWVDNTMVEVLDGK